MSRPILIFMHSHSGGDSYCGVTPYSFPLPHLGWDLSSHGYLSVPTASASTSRFPRPVPIGSRGQCLLVPMASASWFPWPVPLGSHGQYLSVPTTSTSRFPRLVPLRSHGQCLSVPMASASRFPWPVPLGSHGQCLSAGDNSVLI